MELTQIDALKCPNCGAGLDGKPIDGMLVCPYCGSRFMVTGAQAEGASANEEEDEESSYEESFDTIEDLVIWYCETLEDDAEDSDYLFVGEDLSDLPKYRKAATNFRIPAEERVHLIYDDTVFGSCKTGFAITDQGLYYNYSESGCGSMDWDLFTDYKVKKLKENSSDIRLSDLNLTVTSADLTEPLHDMLCDMHDQMIDDFFGDQE